MAQEHREVRFSRQAPLLGEEGMKSIANSSVLIHGLGGVGVEIGTFSVISFLASIDILFKAKNLILTGIGNIMLHDESVLETCDLSSQVLQRNCEPTANIST
jgi:molybdopterin/thiamine biosynthesis adenylyltransferase